MASTQDGVDRLFAQATQIMLDPDAMNADELCEGNRTAQGLKVYYDAGIDADIDIIAIPGFAADPERNWTWLDTGYNWLSHRDGLQSVFPRSRIMIHQYNSQPGGQNKVDTTIYSLASDLLSILYQKRQNNQKRPMAFLAHSMGGLLVAQSLITAHNQRNQYLQFLESFAACVFFGTPFRGLEGIDSALEAIEVRRGPSFYRYLLSNFMRPGSKELEQLRYNFLQAREQLRDDENLRIDLYSIYETQGSKRDRNGNPVSLGVSKESAVIESHGFQGIARTHANLVRFENPQEHDYCDILLPILREFTKKAVDRTQERLRIEKRFLTAEDQREIDKIIDWLSPPDVSKDHIMADEQHQEGTGRWLIQSDEFQRWIASRRGTHLWLYGKSGYGKTVLFYSMVQHLEREAQGTNCGVAKFYFTFRDAEKQTYSGLILSLVAQFAFEESALVLLREAYNNRHKQRPGSRDLEHIFVSSLADYDQVVVCLDAIDECSKAARHDILAKIKQLAQGIPKLKILLTSQPLDEVEKVLIKELHGEMINLDSKAGNTDIENYLNAELKFEDKKRKAMIVQHLTNMAEGSFRWVALQLQEVKHMVLMDNETLVQALNDLPSDLYKTYDRILTCVEKADREIARRMLQWVAFAVRSLTIDEISDAILIDTSGQGRVALKSRSKLHNLKTLLAGLVVFTENPGPNDHCCGLQNCYHRILRNLNDHKTDQDVVQRAQLAHSSVRTYLLSMTAQPIEKWVPFEAGISHGELADSCLIYLSSYMKHAKRRKTVEDFTEFPLLRYSARLWYHHAILRNDNKWHHEFALLRSQKRTASWLLIGDPERRAVELLGYDNYSTSKWTVRVEGRYYACYFGLYEVTKAIIAQDGPNPNIDGMCLRAASGRGHDDILSLFCHLPFGFGSISGDDFCDALQIACYYRQLDTVKALVERIGDSGSGGKWTDGSLDNRALKTSSAIINLMIGDQSDDIDESHSFRLHSVLNAATRNKTLYNAVRSLLADGTSFDFKNGKGGNAIRNSHETTQFKLVQLLLANIATFRKDSQLKGITASSSLKRMRYCLEELPQSTGPLKDLLLSSVRYPGNSEMIQLLLDQGADVNSGIIKQRHTALHVALSCCRRQFHERFARSMDDPDSRDNVGGSILLGDAQLVELLLKYGADPNLPDSTGQSGLMMAVDCDIGIFEMILNSGADVNFKDGYGRTALIIAAALHRNDIVRLLLANGAAVNAETFGTSALMMACSHTDWKSAWAPSAGLQTVQSLLDHGASLTSGDGTEYGINTFGYEEREHNALQDASYGGNEDIVKLILRVGADNERIISRWPQIKTSALVTAAKCGNTGIMKLLLRNGAQMTVQDVQLSCPKGPLDISSVAALDLLIREGIVLTLEDEIGRATLSAALKRVSSLSSNTPLGPAKEMVQFLVENGALFEERLPLELIMTARDIFGAVPLKTGVSGTADVVGDKDQILCDELEELHHFVSDSAYPESSYTEQMESIRTLVAYGAKFKERLSGTEMSLARHALGDTPLPTHSGVSARLYEDKAKREDELFKALEKTTGIPGEGVGLSVFDETIRLLVADGTNFDFKWISCSNLYAARGALGDYVVLRTKSGEPIQLEKTDRESCLNEVMDEYFMHREVEEDVVIQEMKWLVQHGAQLPTKLSTRRMRLVRQALGEMTLLAKSGMPVKEINITPRESPYSSDFEEDAKTRDNPCSSDFEDDNTTTTHSETSSTPSTAERSAHHRKYLYGYDAEYADQCQREDLYDSIWPEVCEHGRFKTDFDDMDELFV